LWSSALGSPRWLQGLYKADLIGDGADSERWQHSYRHSSHSDLHGCLWEHPNASCFTRD
jgi:hypothetical protein